MKKIIELVKKIFFGTKVQKPVVPTRVIKEVKKTSEKIKKDASTKKKK